MQNSSFDDDNLETFCTNKHGAIFVNGIQNTERITQDLYFKNVSLADAEQDFLRVLFVSDGEGVNKGFKLSYAIYHDPPAPMKELEVVEVDGGDRVFVSDGSVGGGDEGSVGAQEGGKVSSATGPSRGSLAVGV